MEKIRKYKKSKYGWEIPILGSVAAGLFKYADEDYKGLITISEEDLPRGEDIFALEVNGNSMVDLGINYGDYAIIKKQNHGKTGDIVIANVGEEATLKRLKIDRERVFLQSANEDYDDIQVDYKDLYINGVLLGICKR